MRMIFADVRTTLPSSSPLPALSTGSRNTRWFAVGFSNDADIASAVLLRHPRLLAGAVLLSALVPFAAASVVDPIGILGRHLQRQAGSRHPSGADATAGQAAPQASAEVVELSHPYTVLGARDPTRGSELAPLHDSWAGTDLGNAIGRCPASPSLRSRGPTGRRPRSLSIATAASTDRCRPEFWTCWQVPDSKGEVMTTIQDTYTRAHQDLIATLNVTTKVKLLSASAFTSGPEPSIGPGEVRSSDAPNEVRGLKLASLPPPPPPLARSRPAPCRRPPRHVDS